MAYIIERHFTGCNSFCKIRIRKRLKSLVLQEDEKMERTEGKLTTGPITSVLMRLSLPIVASGFLSTAYSITDMAWVGQLGGEILTGVGVGSMYVWLSQGLATLSQMGGQVQVAQALGRGSEEDARQYARGALQLSIIFGLLFGVLCLVFTDPMVAFFGVKGTLAIRAAKIYMRITCGLIVFSYLGQVLTGLYTAQGNSTIPLVANFIGLALNMLLDPLMILGIGSFPRMETYGAALATVISQFVVVFVLVAGIYNKKTDNILRKVCFFERTKADYIKGIIRIGGPSAIQGTVFCLISMTLSKLAGRFGDTAIAILRVGVQIESVALNIARGFKDAINAFVGQNFGAEKMDRIKAGYKIALKIVVVWSSFVAIAFLAIPEKISGVFFHTPDEIELFAGYLIVIGFSEVFNCVEMLSIGAISGLGNTKLCSIISITLTGLRIPMALVLCNTALGVNGIWWAITISSIAKGIVLYFAFYRECRKFI